LEAIVGTSLSTPGNSGSTGLVGRWDGFYVTWLSSSYGPRTPGGTLLWLVLVLVAVAAVLLRVRRIRPLVFAVVVVAGGSAYLARALVDPATVIPGLLVTVPVLWTMAWFVAWTGRPRRWAIAALGCGAGALGILATQYSIGGGVEWGGRYFAVLLPVGTAVVVTGAIPVLRRVLPGGVARRMAVASAVTVTAVVSVLALATLRNAHHRAEVLSDRIASAAEGAAGAGGEAPIVLTPNRLLPQLLHQDLDHYGWVAASASQLPGFASQLAQAGVERAVLVAPDAGELVDGFSGWTIRSSVRSGAYDVVLIERGTP
jgi:hypothetical protein